jgi:choline dehydrogenase
VDVLILGGGTSGSALAGLLVERGDATVLVAEAGPDPGPRDGGGWPPDLVHAGALGLTHDWGYASGPEIPGRTVPFERARVLGGCSAHNGCAAIWGHRLDYDAWAAAGCDGWSTDEVLPFLRAATERLRVHPQGPEVLTPLQGAAREALIAAGVPATDDLNDLTEDVGVAGSPVNIVDGVRFNAAFAYLDPVRGRPGLEIRGDTLADRLLVRGGRVVGARLIGPDGPYDQPAGRTVVCGGAYGSPAILQRSGIGDPDVLRRAGVEPVHDLEGVGANLHDHPAAVLGFRPAPELVAAMAAFAETRWCPEEQVIAKARSGSCREAFDLHVYPVHGPGAERVDLPVACMTPRSRGAVAIRSADPEAAPAIDHRYLSDPEGADAAVLRDGLALVREAAATPALAPLLGDLVDGDEPLDRIVRHYYHPVGTCRMGRAGDPGAVVGPDGAVHGLDGAFVCDCSIMPVVPRANTNVPAVMVAERLAARLTLAL